MKPITITSYRRDVARAPDGVLDEALPDGAFRASDLRRLAGRMEDRLFRFMKRQWMPGMRAVVLTAGDGERTQTLVEIWRTEHAWVLDSARSYPIRLAQGEQVRLFCAPRDYHPPLPLPWYLRRNGVLQPDDDYDMTAPPPRTKGPKPALEDLGYLDGFAL